PEGNRLDVAIGFLGPNVDSNHVMAPISSGGDSYYMPAIGWAKHTGNIAYGVGMFAQGGMGTEYAYGYDGLPERSELGVGRLIAPLSYNANDKLTIGGSLDFVWAMLDLRMAMPLEGMVGLLSAPPEGNLATALQTMYCGTGCTTPTDPPTGGATPVRLDFSDGSDYTGKAKGYGFAGKLGFTYKASPTVTIGGVYHTKTSLNDLETSSNGAKFVIAGDEANGLPGKITVKDFQWPATAALGVAVQATPKLMVAADVKYIGWEDVMKDFKMTYSTTAMGDNSSASFALPQNWEDQVALKLGVAYKYTDALTLRAGASFADNPIPDSTMNYLFPAIEKNHYTLGFGYAFNPVSDLNFSLTYAPEVKQTADMGWTVTHSQTNWQLMYSHRF
ncbi:MAG: outer membrane protein transport protein, partial [Hydrogenophilaceae bacterium]